MPGKFEGSTDYFNIDWKNRIEKRHNYFTPNNPETQMQLAFKSHYELFETLFFKGTRGKCLEVGCGRGNLSLYFAYRGWEPTLLDYSESAITVARENFDSLGFTADFTVGDANKLPFKANSFDCTFSVGLLEHFENVAPSIKEQHRVLKKGGVFIGYVVPERTLNVQTFFKPLNKALSLIKKRFDPQVDAFKKDPGLLFRSTYGSEHYLPIMETCKFSTTGSFGIFPIPLISYSEIYPFTPLPEKLERMVVAVQKGSLAARELFTKNPWKCSEFWGQAFVVWGVK